MHKHANKIPITHKKMSLPNFGYISNSQSIKNCPTMSKIISNTRLNQWLTLSKLDNTKQLNNSKMPPKKINLPPHNNFQPNHITSKNSHESKWQKKKIITMPTIKFSTKQVINKLTNKNKKKKKKKMISPWSP